MGPQLEQYSVSLRLALQSKQAEIPWAEEAVRIYQLIEEAFTEITARDKQLPEYAQQLGQKVKELEVYLSLDLTRHITYKNANTPYYISRITQQIEKIVHSFTTNNNGGIFQNSVAASRMFDHLSAELQATFNEYGFCDTLDTPIYNVNEATVKLHALSLKLSTLEKQSTAAAAATIATLHDAVATQSSYEQAMTQQNVDQMSAEFSELSRRIRTLGNKFSASHMQGDAPGVFMEYLAQQYLVNKPFVAGIYHADNTYESVNGHMIHPGTRGWLIERVKRWLLDTDDRLFYVAGKQGTGKSALCSAICKLFTHHIVAAYFCSDTQGNKHNTVNAMIQSISAGMCHTMPEYLNWLDDRHGDSDLSPRIQGDWRDTYDLLIKQPIQALYGHGGSANHHLRRRLIVVDGTDEMCAEEQAQFKEFTKCFIKDISASLCMLVSVRSRVFGSVIGTGPGVEGVRFEDRGSVNRHIRDIEVYLSTSLGAVLSGEDEASAPQHARADETTLQNTIDELLKCSSGRFDYAISLMSVFASEFGRSGQFLGSVKRATGPVRTSAGSEYDQRMSDFASPYRAYRDKEGRAVTVRVMRQSQYLMDKTRVALIRGRQLTYKE